jgi:hypothetical protein
MVQRMKKQQPVIPAPQWLKDSMARLRQEPPPTSQQVEIQFRAAEAMRLNYDDNNGPKLQIVR